MSAVREPIRSARGSRRRAEGKQVVTEFIKPDICVIGGGSGGLAVAAAAAAFGVSVVLIEKGQMGGEALNSGSLASKALIAAARRAEAPRRAAPFGVMAQRPAIDFAKVRDHVHGVIAAIAPNGSKERLGGLGVRVIEGAARFIGRDTVAAGDDIAIKARRFVIATGSSPGLPPIPGLKDTPHFTSETIFDLTQCPEHLIVIGAGSVGLELAQAFRRLGAEVTVLEAAEPLAKDDPECAAVVLEQLAREGIALRSGVEVLRAELAGPKVRVTVKGAGGEEAVEGSHLLVAARRSANIDSLDLAAAGIRTGPNGIVVDKGLRTSNKRVYAVGGVTGGPQFTHVANYHAGLVIRRALFRQRAKVNDDIIPRVTFTDPELAHVGLNEEAARKRHRQIRVLRAAYHDNDRAQAERETQGHIKVITAKNGRILGATIVGARACELIAIWALAIQQGMKVDAFADLVVPYPTFAEVGKRAALSSYTPNLTSPWVRRIIALLRGLG
jgi:pyruvate/2-oxoglutarate dehydrogenase complex dihydrolipoamide dehydrogenase (E3) component